MSDINTIRQRLHAKVKEKYPHITPKQVDEEIDYYFKYVKQKVLFLEKPEVVVGIVGRFVVLKKQMEQVIWRINRALERVKDNENYPEWRRLSLEKKLKSLLEIQQIKNDVYEKGKTYKSIKRKRKDGRVST